MDLICPKCQGTMRSYERSGVTVDQCNDCRGIFLDRGELERLVDAENAYHASPAGRVVTSSPARPPAYGYPAEDHRRYEADGRYENDRRRHDDESRYYGEYRGTKHKRRSFLEELFD